VRIDEQKLRVSVVLSACTSYQYSVEIVLFLLMECVVDGL
jgi:Fe-S cluster assembly iron-binding protein IscA